MDKLKLLQWIDSSDQEKINRATALIFKIPEEYSIEELLKAVEASDLFHTRKLVMRTLKDRAHEIPIEILKNRIDRDYADIPAPFMELAGASGRPELVPILERLAKIVHPSLAGVFALDALISIPGPESTEALIRLARFWSKSNGSVEINRAFRLNGAFKKRGLDCKVVASTI